MIPSRTLAWPCLIGNGLRLVQAHRKEWRRLITLAARGYHLHQPAAYGVMRGHCGGACIGFNAKYSSRQCVKCSTKSSHWGISMDLPASPGGAAEASTKGAPSPWPIPPAAQSSSAIQVITQSVQPRSRFRSEARLCLLSAPHASAGGLSRCDYEPSLLEQAGSPPHLGLALISHRRGPGRGLIIGMAGLPSLQVSLVSLLRSYLEVVGEDPLGLLELGCGEGEAGVLVPPHVLKLRKGQHP